VWVRTLRLVDFRTYDGVEIDLHPGVTAFVGANGQGKTNLVEAIGYCATLGSHRVATDAPLVRDGATRAVVSAGVVRRDRDVLVEIEINPGRANRARINRSPTTRSRDVVGIVRSVVFAPEDLALVKGDPSERRRYLDELLVQRTPRLAGTRSDYERIIKQRNALLKSSGTARRTDLDSVERTLSAWDEQLADVGAELTAARVGLLALLRPHVEDAYEQIAGGPDAVSASAVRVDYAPAVGGELADSTEREAWRAALLEHAAQRRREELDRGVTLIGPHRDDVVLRLAGHPFKGFASQGESWSMALALRLAAFEVLRADGEDPVLVLDDVFAELDGRRRAALAARVAGCEQVLLTAAVDADIPANLTGDRFVVERGRVTRG